MRMEIAERQSAISMLRKLFPAVAVVNGRRRRIAIGIRLRALRIVRVILVRVGIHVARAIVKAAAARIFISMVCLHFYEFIARAVHGLRGSN
ncbi:MULTISPECIES: hypothetical protein [unclassified Mesorhizobium]|uniref:hypothetical protein n=1 Tax=unclassified Mesorhizobium TaxID=325217 RepID=UPI0015E43E35|nr:MULTISPECIES: hypothetical protein [unclassified Mesorhizobium]